MLALAWQNVLRMRPALNQFPGQLVAWCLLATGLLAFTTLNGPAPSLAEWLGDTDDAVRLVTVRELLAGAPWFDTTLPRVGAPEPLLSHWSRLIDAPLACLIAVLTPIFGPEAARVSERGEGVESGADLEDDVAAAAPIPAVGSSERHVLLAAEMDHPVAAATG
jgi:hypothetical protein